MAEAHAEREMDSADGTMAHLAVARAVLDEWHVRIGRAGVASGAGRASGSIDAADPAGSDRSGATAGKALTAAEGTEHAFRFPSAAAASLALWVFVLAVGGGCLVLYYSRLRYLPEITWQESLTFLFALSIVGACVVVMFGLMAFLPGLIWSEALVWDCTFKQRLCYENDEKDLEPCPSQLWRRIGMPFAVFAVLAHVGMVLGFNETWMVGLVGASALLATFLCQRQFSDLLVRLGYEPPAETKLKGSPSTSSEAGDKSIWRRAWCWLWPDLTSSAEAPTSIATSHPSTTAGCAAGTAQEAEVVPEPDRGSVGHAPKSDRPTVARGTLMAKVLFWFPVSALVGGFSIVLLPHILAGGPLRWSLNVVCALVVVAANFTVALLFRQRRSGALLTGVIAALVLLTVGEVLEGQASLVSRLTAHFGVGRDARGVLVAKPDAVELLRGQEVLFELVHPSCPQGAVRVRNVSMLSRLGINFLLLHDGRTFTLPKDLVWSWSTATDQPGVPAKGNTPGSSAAYPETPCPPVPGRGHSAPAGSASEDFGGAGTSSR